MAVSVALENLLETYIEEWNNILTHRILIVEIP